ncbi:MAG TPA: SET domain-containing protein-lysine N-methyltransferase [Chitinophagaceae bacterium]|nr:SET domain-containing protein-lysine N-methyltransferase [Chitinophagaceae bacterium]
MKYVMGLSETMVIDGERNGNDARFMNHHCSPNCEVYFINDTPFIYAIEDVQKGEELTFDYHLNLISETPLTSLQKMEWFPCNCGSPVCRGTLISE